MTLVDSFQAKQVKAVYDHFCSTLGEKAGDAAALTNAYFALESATQISAALGNVASAAGRPETERQIHFERRQRDPLGLL